MHCSHTIKKKKNGNLQKIVGISVRINDIKNKHNQLTCLSSTSNTNVLFGGISGGLPLAPYLKNITHFIIKNEIIHLNICFITY